MEKATIEQQKEFLRKLEDIKNSCESLVEKVGHLQVDLFNYPNVELEKTLNKLNNDFSNQHIYISEVVETYHGNIDKLES
jgi:bifunctional N-acetylglucosamine-1-phosphate-uridyltransferase/glucosamine-1-phosphate-acetyltransferase GlmU-like protein